MRPELPDRMCQRPLTSLISKYWLLAKEIVVQLSAMSTHSGSVNSKSYAHKLKLATATVFSHDSSSEYEFRHTINVLYIESGS